MPAKKRPRLRRRPHVALIIETSLQPGRGILRGIAQYVREHGPWSIYYEPRGLEAAPPAWLKAWRGDGIIARLSNARITAAVLKTGLPVVNTLGPEPHRRIPLVASDNKAIARLAAEHLLERGFRHFGYCGIRRALWSRETGDAFMEAVIAAGGDCRLYELPVHKHSQPSWEMDQDKLAAWIERLPKPAGIMACSDPRAQRVLEACRRTGVAVPDDVAVVGTGNDETTCELCDPPLSSVIARHTQIGYEAAAMLEHLMRGGTPPPEPLRLQPLGVVTRRSTDAIAVDDAETAAAVRFIREHASDGIGVQDVAEHCSLSLTQLKRRFRRFLGRTVHDQILRDRITRVQQLLTHTTISIARIAAQTGFGRQEYLGVVFKARLGKTPGDYRRESQLSWNAAVVSTETR
jgi:LacI family transcriptional regulator